MKAKYQLQSNSFPASWEGAVVRSDTRMAYASQFSVRSGWPDCAETARLGQPPRNGPSKSTPSQVFEQPEVKAQRIEVLRGADKDPVGCLRKMIGLQDS